MYLTIVCQIYWNLFFESTFRRSRMLFGMESVRLKRGLDGRH